MAPKNKRTTTTQQYVHAWISFVTFMFLVLAVVIPTGEDRTIAGASSPPSESASTPPTTGKRGKDVGDSFTAHDLYLAYKEVESEYQEKAFNSTQDWRILVQRDGVEVGLLEHASDPSCPYIRMTAIIPTSVQFCWDFLKLGNWDQSMPKMDPFYEGVTLHGEYVYEGVHMVLARKRTQRILAFGKRDLVFLSVSDLPLPDGTWVSGTVSVVTDKLPRQKGYTRAFQDSIAFYTPLNHNQATKLTIICRIDLNDSADDGSGGLFPMWLYVKTIGATGARSVLSLRDLLMEMAAQRQEEEALKEQEEGSAKTNRRKLLPIRFPFRKKRVGLDHEGDSATIIEKNRSENMLQSFWRRRRRRGTVAEVPIEAETAEDFHDSATPLGTSSKNAFVAFLQTKRR